jgi:hypothetical protein
MVLLLHVMLVIGLAAKGASIEPNKFCFCHDDLNKCVGRTSKKYALDKPTLPSLWPMQARTNFTTLQEAGFLLSKKPKCPFVNQVGDDRSAPVNQPLACTPHNLLSDGTSMSIDHWIQMFGPNQGVERRFVIPTDSNYPFCKKINGRWDKLLKPHN